MLVPFLDVDGRAKWSKRMSITSEMKCCMERSAMSLSSFSDFSGKAGGGFRAAVAVNFFVDFVEEGADVAGGFEVLVDGEEAEHHVGEACAEVLGDGWQQDRLWP